MVSLKTSFTLFKNVKHPAFISNFCDAKNLPHNPVMVDEMLTSFKPNDHQTYIDMTFGAGGHTQRLLSAAPNIRIIALDRDPIAHQLARKLAEKYPNRLIPLLGRFSELPALLKTLQVRQNTVDGILFDFGCSSMQFDEADRGFSLSKDGPLDMRMDGDRFPDSLTAYDVLAGADEESIAKILKIYGEEKQAKKIARAVVEGRYGFKRLQTTGELATLVDTVCYDEVRLDKVQRRSHSATKTFQALRIFVNNELNEINYGMVIAQRYLKLGGRLVAISFHSLEDTIVKRHIHGNVIDNAANALPLKYSDHTLCYGRSVIESIMEMNWRSLYKQVVTPSYEEVENNPRSRSAKLRAAVRIL